jgi:hypothetical protein
MGGFPKRQKGSDTLPTAAVDICEREHSDGFSERPKAPRLTEVAGIDLYRFTAFANKATASIPVVARSVSGSLASQFSKSASN